MNDTNELKAAAERLSHEAYNGVDHAEMYEQPLQRARDAMLLAREYLAEHPADDVEPVTEEWVIEVYRKQAYWPTIWLGAYVNISNGSAWCNGRMLCDAKTRGDVRRLCRALGIELKEVKQ